MKVRTRCNLMIGKRMVKRGDIVDESLLPERFRNEEHVSRDLTGRDGRVLMLHGLVFGGQYGPSTLLAGDPVELEKIPERVREGLKEGKDYVVEWDEKMQKKIHYEAREAENKIMFGKKIEVYDA